jgi:hypothetical protein
MLYEEMPLQRALAVYSPQLLPSTLLAASEANSKIIVGIEIKLLKIMWFLKYFTLIGS